MFFIIYIYILFKDFLLIILFLYYDNVIINLYLKEKKGYGFVLCFKR